MTIHLKPPPREPPSVLVKARLPGPVAADLELYRELYREAYGEEIRLDALVVEIVRQFLERDPTLRRRRRHGRRENADEREPGPARAGSPEVP